MLKKGQRKLKINNIVYSLTRWKDYSGFGVVGVAIRLVKNFFL